MLKRTNSNISNVFMKFWYIEHYGACYGDGIDAKMNYYNHTKWSMEIVSNTCSRTVQFTKISQIPLDMFE